MAHPGKVGRIIGCVIKLSEKPGQQAKWLSLQTIAPLRHHSVVVASGSGCQFARTMRSESPRTGSTSQSVAGSLFDEGQVLG